MTEIWFISDTHFFHKNILNFIGLDGKGVRPQFSSIEHMNEVMVRNWNEKVRPNDKVWHLGDVSFKMKVKEKEIDELLGSLNGKKRLVPGNHDPLKNPLLHKHFEKIEWWKGFPSHNFTATHVPLRLDQLRDGKYNVHGHIHERVMKEPEYISVCVEQIMYTPIHIDEIVKLIKWRELHAQ